MLSLVSGIPNGLSDGPGLLKRPRAIFITSKLSSNYARREWVDSLMLAWKLSGSGEGIPPAMDLLHPATSSKKRKLLNFALAHHDDPLAPSLPNLGNLARGDRVAERKSAGPKYELRNAESSQRQFNSED